MAAVAIGAAGKRTRRAWPVAWAFGLALSLATPNAHAARSDDFLRGAKGVAEDAFDLAVLRPAGIVALAAGSVFFVASLPAVAPYPAIKGSTEGIRGAYDVFVYPPYEYTFQRDLGDF